jgi:ribosome-binding protein aMBF1 (putative translation factor)
MTRRAIPDEPSTYGDEDFKTSTERVKAARDKLLKNPKAAEAYGKLGDDIAKRLDRKRATLAQVRQAVGLTQKQLAESLDMDQGDISRLEHRQNLHLATLARFIEATGGRLRIIAVYEDREVDLDVGDVAPVDNSAELAST